MNFSENDKPAFSVTLSWIIYDFANTIYSMNVVTMYFSTWLVVDLGLGDHYVSYANSISMILVALTMPVLGEISDRFNRKMPFLFIFTAICILSTALIGFVGKSVTIVDIRILWVMLFFVIANYSYQGGLVFYNALLPHVTSNRSIGRVSGYGVAIGYMGSIFGLIMVLPFVEGSIYGLKIPFIEGGGSVASFIPTAVLFMIFAVPTFIFIRDNPGPVKSEQRINVVTSFRRVWEGLTNTRKYPGVTRFLIAKYFYEDAIHTIIIFMAIYAQKVMEFTKSETTTFLIAVTPSAVIGSILCGILTDHLGAKKTLNFVLVGWIISLMIIVFTMKTWIFWLIAAVVGILLGSTWTSARPLLISLVPKEMLGEFFGLYSLSGKLAAIAGPLLWAFIVDTFSSRGDIFKYKAAVASLAVLLLVGLIILQKVPDLWTKQES
ncbi:MAG: MFS transporter [candidate division KSB1 bacterium]|jgi:UMF1 family MFS transporter|nr:MFS transporter [candidate division KSB1 bacterium]